MIYSLWINKNGVVGINDNQSKWINSIERYLNQNEIIETVEMNRLDWVPCKYAFLPLKIWWIGTIWEVLILLDSL